MRSLSILVIDDDEDVREVLAELLILEGHLVSTAVDGPQGVSRAISQAPEIVLIDQSLPGFGGDEVARRIRARLGHAVRLIALSGSDEPVSHFFDASLAKPATSAEILAALEARPQRQSA